MRRTVGERAPAQRAGRPPRHVRLFLRLSRRELPTPVCGVAVEHGIGVPAGDGVTLLTDHYRPLLDGPRPTLLVRTPYGRGFPWDYVYGALFAGQGFHVVIQSCRGTGGSAGQFEPFVDEAADAQAAVTWLRGQEWFSGALGSIGASYLGFTQWALATDPPPELAAMVVQVGSDDFYGFLYPGGAFALEATLVGVASMLSMQHGFGRFLLAIGRLLCHIRRAEKTLPLVDAYPVAVGQRAPWLEQWLAHPAPGDPYWAPRRAAAAAGLIPPTSLLTGWWDVCLDQTLALYRRLRDGGRPVRLVVGPWAHSSGFSQDMPVVLGEALSWLRGYLDGERGGLPQEPVRVHVSETGGPGEWRDLPDWPPPLARPQPWHLRGDGTLATAPPGPAAVSSFRYDPAAPTPSVGGPGMDARNAGSRRNNALEARADVLTFTGPVLGEPLEVMGPVSVRLQVSGSSPHFDVFARLCDVDPQGRSWNVCDGLLRLGGGSTAAAADGAAASGPGASGPGASGQGDGRHEDGGRGASGPGDGRHEDGGRGASGPGASGPGDGRHGDGGHAASAPDASRARDGWQTVTVPMSATAHRFGAGHRLRLQLSGGAHPRFMRNTGAGEPLPTATRLVPVDIQIRHDPADPCVLTLPAAQASGGR